MSERAKDLPEDLVQEILYLLPIKSLVKCTSVCKAWYSVITSSTFISTHLQRSLSNPNPPLVLVRRYSVTKRNENYSFFSDDAGSFARIAKLESPFPVRGQRFFRIVGTIHGLVCISDDLFDYTDAIILWNPMIQKHVNLPAPLFNFRTIGGSYMFVVGFGFDSMKNDYKVIRVAYAQGDDGLDLVPPKAEICSLKERGWRAIDASSVQSRVVEDSWSQCFLHGNVHWLAYTKKQKSGPFDNCVLMFNVEEETFKKMKLPEELVELFPLKLKISVIAGCLSVLECRLGQFSWHHDIWMRREYDVAESWAKMYRVNPDIGVEDIFGLRTNGDILVLPHGELVSMHSFDPRSREMTDLRIRGPFDGFYAGAYTGSLVLLDKKSGAISPMNKSYVEWVEDDESRGLEADVVDTIEEKEMEQFRKAMKINTVMHTRSLMVRFGLLEL